MRRVLLRIHDSGDFFASWYMRAMYQAVGQRSAWLDAYGYTKRLGLLERFQAPDNFSVLQSVGGLLDAQIDETRPHAKVFLTVAEREAAGYADGNESDLPAVRGESVGLVYHGTEGVDDVETEGNVEMRGGIQAGEPGCWTVFVPMGLKNRRLYEAVYDFRDVATEDLHKQITVKSGNEKVVKTARKLGAERGVRYKAAAFNLPALATCPMAGACSAFCYALQGSFGFKTVRESRARAWAVVCEAHRRGGESLAADVIGAALDTLKPRGVA